MIARLRATWAEHPAAWSAVLVVVAALAASVNGLGNGFTYDDIPIIVENPMVTELHGLREYLTDSYWGPSRGNSLYRPVTVVAFALEWAAGHGSPFPFHLANVVLYAGSAIAVLALAWACLPPAAALLAAVVWAIHPVHVEAVANVVGQSEFLAAIPMLLAVTIYLRARRRGPLSGSTVTLITALYALALLTKEHGIVLPALLVIVELTFRTDRGDPAGDSSVPPTPASVPWPLVRTLTLVTVAYLVIRISVLQGFAGDAPHPALQDLPAAKRLWVMLGIVPEFARLLWWPARLFADYSPQALPFLDAPSIGHLPGVAWLGIYAALLVWAWRRDRVARLALLWLPVTLAPVSNLPIATGVLVAERTLLLPSVAIVLLIAVAAVRLAPHVARLGTRWVRWSVGFAVAAVIVAGAARSADRQLVWEDNATLFATTVADAPANFRAHHALGEMFGAAGAWTRAEVHLRTADSLFPGYDLLELSLARVLHFDDRCPDALSLYEAVLSKRGDAEVAAIGRAACLLEMRRLSDARAEAVRGVARGASVGSFGLLLQKAESSLVANDTVDSRNRWARAGAPVSKSNARLRVPVLLQRPAGAARGRRLPESPPDPP